MTDMAHRGSASREFSIGAVLARTMHVFKSGAGRFIALAAVPALPVLLPGLVVADPRSVPWYVWLLAGLLQFFLYFLAQGASVYGAFQEMRGQRFTLAESLEKCLGRVLPLIGAAVLSALGLMLGFLVFVIPFFILAIFWCVTVPACVVERLGPIRSLGRSAELTRGARLKIFVLFLIFIVGAWVAGLVLRLVAAAIGGGMAAIWASYGLGAVWGALGSVLVTVVYYELRAAKEGIDLDQLVRVFD